MRVITVLVGNVYLFPPVLSLLHAFEDLQFKSIFITTKAKKNLRDDFYNTTIEEIELDYEDINSPIKKLIMIPQIRKRLWSAIDKYYDDDSVLWIVTDVTVKYLGNQLVSRKYILHLLELLQELVYYHRFPVLKLDKEKIGNNALEVVVPEYNRAHLIKTWWKLKKLPCILPNKPFCDRNWTTNEHIQDENAKKIIDSIGSKKIILYQGIMGPERPLDAFINAVDEYNGKYAFVVMSGGTNIYQNTKSENYYFIPFIAPPNHLQVTSHAHIGVLSYVPTNSTYSPLNALYCAPNKTFEYSMFGIPMIGNDIPGLKYLFDVNDIGRCFDEFECDSVCRSIDEVEEKYNLLSSNSRKYFSECDYRAMLSSILAKHVMMGEYHG